MKKVLYVLGGLDDRDVDWLLSAGERRVVDPDTELVTLGKPIEYLYIVIDGRLEVRITKESVLATLGAGEIIGELSFLDSRPPNATVVSVERSAVLAVPAGKLERKLKTDTGFGYRFYRALGVMLTDRLRDTVGLLAYGKESHLDESVEEANELSPDLMENLSLAATRFDHLLKRLRTE
ncbi:MAG: cyclic nucleotide-binding domain-containing protein [Pseudomonadota bacterium]